MLFNSYQFILIFLPLVMLGYVGLKKSHHEYVSFWLIGSSLAFYGYWKPKFLIILLLSITVNLVIAKILIFKKNQKKNSKLFLIIGILFNLVLLGYFKYTGFLISNINTIFSAGLNIPSILLPLGISFITFQKIAFLVDIEKDKVSNFRVRDYIFFVTFFPQLIAGPIVHHAEIMPQLTKQESRDIYEDFSVGISIFILGLFKKVIIADCFATYADLGYQMLGQGVGLNLSSAWITVLSYSLQLYFDFSAYSDMAIGLARIFGIYLPLNFNSPYKASCIIDFWRYWHITLSNFLKEYLYFPLGGNRQGHFRRYLNLMIVMLVGGLWHGANWTFAVWGGIHGILLIINHFWRKLNFNRFNFYNLKITKIFFVTLTFLCVTLAWVPFRSNSIHESLVMYKCLFDYTNLNSLHEFFIAQTEHLKLLNTWFAPPELWPVEKTNDFLSKMVHPIGLLLIIGLFIVFVCPNLQQLFSVHNITNQFRNKTKVIYRLDFLLSIFLSLAFVISLLNLSHVSPFLYFQF